MPQRSWLLGLVVLVLVTGVVLLRAFSGGAEPGAVLPVTPTAGVDAPTALDPTLPPGGVDAEVASGSAGAAGRSAVGDDVTFRLEGLVTLDGPWPADEELFVVAGDLRAAVRSDGGFALDVPTGTERLDLDLEGRYLGLARPMRLEGDELAPGGPVELAADLGAWLRLQLVPAGDVTLAELDAAEGEVAVWQGSPTWARALVPTGGGAFEAGALRVDQLVSVSVEGAAFADAGETDLRAFAGRPLDVTLEVRRGATVAGRVVDAEGAPVEDALVSLTRENPLRGSMVRYVDRTSTSTAADGGFRYRGLTAGSWRLEVEADGHPDATLDLGELSDGLVRDDVAVALVRGLAIRGSARLAGGGPVAPELRLTATGSPSRTLVLQTGPDDGTFALDGLEPGSYVLGAAWSDDDGALWRATATGLELTDATGDLEGLELVLSLGDRIAGTARADDGTPLDRFTVEAKPLGADLAVLAKGTLRERFRKAEGRFELVGLAPGAWDVTVSAKDHAASRPVRVHVPEGPHELAVTLERLATVRGIVRGPDGEPVAGAEVTALAPAAVDRDTTDDEGRFELEDVVPGSVSVVAGLEGRRDAAPAALELVPGEERDGVELLLRVGARIVGRVDPSVGDVAARPILASPEDSFQNWKTLADEDGGFVFEGLDPGTWAVMFDWMAGADPDWTVGFAARDEVALELVEGETTEVVLGAPRLGAVALSGLVTDGGEPKPTYLVYVYPEHNDTAKPAAMPLTIARTDSAGRYDLELPGPGTYHFSVGPDTTFQVRFLETVTAAGQATLDFELPGCVIAGRVELADGSPAPRQPLMLVREGAPVDSRTFGDLHSGGSDADGTFRFEDIQPGRYLLRVGGWGLSTGGLGARVLADLEVREGAALEDLLVVVDEEAVVGGAVVDAAGAPVAGARLTVVDAGGQQLLVWREQLSDHAGAFRLLGVGAGPVTVRATTADGRSAEATLDLSPGQVADVALRLDG